MRDDHQPYIINLWGPPGVGKSRTASGLFNAMKFMGLRCELVTERAKFLTYEGNVTALKDSFLLMAQQEYAQRIVRDHVDWIITDSPPGQGIAYSRRIDRKVLFGMHEHFRNRYKNLDVLMLRDDSRPYDTYGRNETEAESRALDLKIAAIWAECTVGFACHNYERVLADHQAADIIIERMVEPLCLPTK